MPVITFSVADGDAVALLQAERATARNTAAVTVMKDLMTFFSMILVSSCIISKSEKTSKSQKQGAWE
jgi:hypothetical protein